MRKKNTQAMLCRDYVWTDQVKASVWCLNGGTEPTRRGAQSADSSQEDGHPMKFPVLKEMRRDEREKKLKNSRICIVVYAHSALKRMAPGVCKRILEETTRDLHGSRSISAIFCDYDCLRSFGFQSISNVVGEKVREADSQLGALSQAASPEAIGETP